MYIHGTKNGDYVKCSLQGLVYSILNQEIQLNFSRLCKLAQLLCYVYKNLKFFHWKKSIWHMKKLILDVIKFFWILVDGQIQFVNS